MDDDFNTANAISVLFELARTGKYVFKRKPIQMKKCLKAFIETFDELSDVLGIKLAGEAEF